MTRRKQRGTTMIEVIAVLGIALVLAAILIPNMSRVVGDLRLRSAADSVGSLMQQARMRAVRDNRYYTVIPANLGAAITACIDTDWRNNCNNDANTGLPNVVLPATTNFANGGGVPKTTEINCGPASVDAGPCPAGVTGLNYTAQAANVPPTFNARGLPCVNSAAPTTEPVWTAGTLCTTTDPAGNLVGFLYTFQYTGRLGAAGYAAIAVTPAGRVTTWMYRGQDAGGNDVWSR
jgi:type II secretory pathway pseudopilin PulG